MNSTDIHHVQKLLEAARTVRAFVRDGGKETFAVDLMRLRAVTGLLIRMSGLAKNLSTEYKTHRPDVRWDAIIDMGDSLVKSPNAGDPMRVWNHARTFIPELILKLAAEADGAERRSPRNA